MIQQEGDLVYSAPDLAGATSPGATGSPTKRPMVTQLSFDNRDLQVSGSLYLRHAIARDVLFYMEVQRSSLAAIIERLGTYDTDCDGYSNHHTPKIHIERCTLCHTFYTLLWRAKF